MIKIEYAQTVFLKKDAKKLKEITGEKAMKDALARAVDFTINNYKKNATVAV